MSIYSCTSKMPRYIVVHMMMRYAKACPNEKEIYKLTCEKNYGFTPNLNVRKLPSLYVISNYTVHCLTAMPCIYKAPACRISIKANRTSA